MKLTITFLLSKLLAFGELKLSCGVYEYKVNEEFEYKFPFTKITSDSMRLQQFLKLIYSEMID